MDHRWVIPIKQEVLVFLETSMVKLFLVFTSHWTQQLVLKLRHWACFMVCKWLRSSGFEVETETDSLVLFNMVTGKIQISWRVDPLIRHIQHFMAHGGSQLSHIYREANGVADILAKLRNGLTSSHITFSSLSIPNCIVEAFRLDELELPSLRKLK
ncbi:hypothetical protein ACH5RR_037372 [Cinchona calisaya]|uniref:RNase H type-1 domain-containing protein n=1 Tax=Cinchona calisaya TaxID=153742 RepID=A0ABD2YBH0_9GENT